MNTTVALEAGGGALLATPVAQGAYTALRYAANLWPQCAAYAVGNGLPVVPFHAVLEAAAGPAPLAAPLPRAAPGYVAARVVAGAWAGGWRGVPVPTPLDPSVAAATPPMGFKCVGLVRCGPFSVDHHPALP